MATESVATIAGFAGALGAKELEARLRRVGEERYHHQHPFHTMMHEGQLSRGQLQAWALNRYYYQSRIPDQRCHHSFAQRGSGLSPRMAQAGGGSRWRCDAGRRHRALDPSGGSDRA